MNTATGRAARRGSLFEWAASRLPWMFSRTKPNLPALADSHRARQAQAATVVPGALPSASSTVAPFTGTLAGESAILATALVVTVSGRPKVH